MPRIYLISGKRYAGKDTVADAIVAARAAVGEQCVRTSFAAGVKADCARIHDLDYDRLMSDTAYKEANRQVLIDHGKAMREIDADYWVKLAWDNVKNNAANAGRDVVFSDFRFPNEEAAIRRLAVGYDVVTIRVVANDDARKSRGWVPSDVDQDISECALDNTWPDSVVVNSGTVWELRSRLATTMSSNIVPLAPCDA